jgi:hypothetical protein
VNVLYQLPRPFFPFEFPFKVGEAKSISLSETVHTRYADSKYPSQRYGDPKAIEGSEKSIDWAEQEIQKTSGA